MADGVKASMRWMLPLGAVLAVAACKKDPGEGSRDRVESAGYELDQPAFFRAAESDDLKVLDEMIDAGMAVDVRDAADRTALHAAAGAGALKAGDFLLDRGLEVDVRDGKGRTPLMEAVMRSTPETVRYVLRQGADPRLKDDENYKPLMLAVREGRAEMVAELAPYVREDLDDSLLVAAILGQADVIDELTNFGASIYARVEDGRTPLMLAAQNGQTEAVDLLLEIGANRFAMDGEGRMAADFARGEGHEELAMRLAGEPREGDFELTEPAELGGEMLAQVVSRMESEAGVAVAMEDPAGEAGEGEGSTPWNTPLPGQGGGALGQLPETLREGAEPVVMLEGAVVGGEPAADAGESAGERAAPPAGAATAEAVEPPTPVVMRAYRQKELPLRVESTTPEAARVRVSGGDEVEVATDEVIPGSNLKVVRIERRMQSGKEGGGEPMEVSVVTVEDTSSGKERELTVGLPALAHDPVALVEDEVGGKYYVARIGQRFRTADGKEYLVGDVRPSQVVIEQIENGETVDTLTLPLHGPRG